MFSGLCYSSDRVYLKIGVCMSILGKITQTEKKADDFGFKWSDCDQIFEQIISECKEIKEEIDQKSSKDNLQNELGDLIHATLSLCLFCGFELEETLQKNLNKFDARLSEVIRSAKAAGYNTLEGQPLETLMAFWNNAKKKCG